MRIDVREVFRPVSILFMLLCLSPSLIFAQTSWKGTTSTDWSNSLNWTNGVPTSSLDAIIGDANFTGANQPNLTANSFCKSLTIGTGVKASNLTTGASSKSLTVSGSITIGANGTITHTGKTVSLSGSWINSGTYSGTASGSTVAFSGSGQSITGVTNFRKLTINSGSTITLHSNITVVNTFTVNGTFIPGQSTLVSGAGTFVVGSGATVHVRAATFAGNYAQSGSTTLNALSIVDYSATGIDQTVSNTLTYGTLRVSGGMTKTLAGNLPALNSSSSAAGNITILAGTLDLSSFTANRGTSVSGGSLTVSNGSTLRIGGTNSFPSNYASRSIGTASTVAYTGTNQTVALESYGHLALSSGAGAATKTFPGSPMTVAGTLSATIGSGSSVVFSAGAALSISGDLTLGSGCTFNGGSFAHITGGNWNNSGTYNGGAGSITLTGTAAAISGTGSNQFATLSITGGGVTAASNANLTVSGDFLTTGAGTFTHSTGGTGTVSLTGSGKSISGTGMQFNHLSVPGSISTSSSLSVSGNLTVNGSLNAPEGTITLGGSGATISGIGAITLNALNIPGTITASTGFSLASNLSIAGNFTATAGTATFSGNTTLSGTANLFNVTLNGTRLQLGSNANLGISGALVLLSGTFDVTTTTPNMVTYNGGSQTVTAGTYHSLGFSGSGTKTPGSGLIVLGDLTISSGSTFSTGGMAHSLHGSWVNNGTFLPASGSVEFTGTADASISGATTFGTLKINKDDATDLVSLNNAISTTNLDMTRGRLMTGPYAVTVTSTRTGDGTITGTITRTHTFVSSVDYAFESPYNTIRFTSPGSVSSITVTTIPGPVGDFPLGGSVNREYSLGVTGAGYSGKLRLRYDDAELNGNDESSMFIWRHSGSWTDVGKSANNTTQNWVEKDGLTSLSGRWTLSDDNNSVQWNGSVSSAWDNPLNWTVVQGSPALPPGAGDIAEIGTSTFANHPIISSDVTVKSISFGSSQSSTITLTSGGSLTVVGNVAGVWSANASHTIAVGSQSMSVGGSLTMSDGTAGHDIHLTLGSGLVSVIGSLEQAGNATVTVSGTGTIEIGGSHVKTGGTFSPGMGTVVFNGGGAQNLAGVTYRNLQMTKSGGTVTVAQPVTVTGNVVMSTGGTLLLNANLTVDGNVTIGSGTGLNSGASTLTVGGHFTKNGAFTAGTGTLLLSGSIPSTLTAGVFNHLTVNKPGTTLSLSGNATVNGNLIVLSGTVDLGSFTADRSATGGTCSLAAGTTLRIGDGSRFPHNYVTSSLSPSSTIEYYGSGLQTVASATYGHLVMTGGGTNAKSLSGAVTVGGNLLINGGATLHAAGFALTAQGDWTNNGSFTPAAGTVNLSGNGKAFAGATTFNNLSVSGSYSASSDLTVNGTMTVSGTFSGGTSTTTIAGTLNNTGALSSAGTITFPGTSAQSLTLNGGFVSTGTVNFNGSVAPVFSGSSPTFHYINLNNTGGLTPNTAWTINGNCAIAAGVTLAGGPYTHVFKGSLTNNGSLTSSGTIWFNPAGSTSLMLRGTSFTSTGTTIFGGTGAITLSGGAPTFGLVQVTNTHPSGVTPLSGWTVTGDMFIGPGATFNGGAGVAHLVSGNFQNSGVLVGGTSTVTLNGPAASVSGSGTTLFNNLTIAGVITATSDFSVSGNFVNNGTFDGTDMTVSFVGSSASMISGTTSPTPLDGLSIAKTAALTTLGVNISGLGSLDIASGTFDQSTFSITQDPVGGVLAVSAGATMKTGTSAFPTFNTYTLNPSSTIEYGGAGAQTILPSPLYGNLTLSNAGTKTAGGALTVRGALGINSVTLADGGNTVTVNGNLGNTGTHTGAGRILLSGGVASHIISGTGAYTRLELNDAIGATLTADPTINGVLTLTNGRITTGANKVIISSTGSVSRTGGYVEGNLQKHVPSGVTSPTFEVGDAAAYAPVLVSLASVTTPGNLTARTSTGDHPAISSSGINPSKSVNRYWPVSNAGVIFTTYDATFNFVPGDIDSGANTSNFSVRRYSAPAWSTPTVGTRTASSTQATGLTAFSDFAVGEATCVLPAIVSHPGVQSVCAGAVATFLASASGDPVPTVQWQVSTDGGTSFTNLSGETSTTLSFTTTAGQNGYQYRAVFTNFCGTATTSAALLTVNQLPSITSNPADAVRCSGTTVTFTTGGTGSPAPTIQWQVSTDSGSSWNHIAGATSDSLSFVTSTSQNGSRYRAVLTNSCGVVNSASALLTVNQAPAITLQPVNELRCAGASVTFTLAASGTPSPGIQWQVSTNGGSSFANLSGETTTSLSFTTTAGQNGNQYRAIITNSCGTATTSAALLTVNQAPSVTASPENLTLCSGAGVSFTASGTGTPAPSIQWQSSTDGGSSWNNLIGEISSILSFVATGPQNGNRYRAVFTNSCGSVNTPPALLTVQVPAAITLQPLDQIACESGLATFSAAASGTPPPALQWQRSTDGGLSFNNMAGEVSTTLSVTALLVRNGNRYRVVATNACGTSTSNSGLLTVNVAPEVTLDPASELRCEGVRVVFSAQVSGSPPPSVQWQVSTDGGSSFDDIPGETASSLSFATSISHNGNRYRARFVNGCGSALSSVATLIVSQPAAVISQPDSQSVIQGQAARFVAKGSGSPEPEIQWQVSTNGGLSFSDLSGESDTVLTFVATLVQDGYLYRALMTNVCNGIASQAALLAVAPFGPPVSISTVAGTPQSAVVKTPFVTNLQTLVIDHLGNPVAGVSVVFEVPLSGPGGAFVAGSDTVFTDASGIGTAGTLTANSIAGVFTINASAAGVTEPATFFLSNMAGAPAYLFIHAGDSQSTTVNSVFGSRLQTRVTDSSGNDLSGVTVSFQLPVAGPGGSFGGGGTTGLSDGSGIASAPSLTANTAAGEFSVIASVPGLPTVPFVLRNTPGPPSLMTPVAGTPQSTQVGSPYPVNPAVRVSDLYGNTVEGVSVVFSGPVAGPGGTFAGGVTSAITGGDGIATSAVVTANSLAGPFEVTASISGIDPALFALENLPGAPSQLVWSNQPSDRVAGQAFDTLLVEVQDTFGNIVSTSTALVTMTIGSNPSGTILGGTSTRSAVAGIVMFGDLHITRSGPGYTLVASLGTIQSESNSFSVSSGPLNGFLVESNTGGPLQPQVAGSSFGIRIVARDRFGNTLPDFSGTVMVTSTGVLSSGGGISPPFVAGTLENHLLTVTNTGSFTVTSSNSSGPETGTSNSFDVNAGPLSSFVVESASGGGIPLQNSGTSFAVRIIARDALDNTVDGFSGNVLVSSDGTLSSGSGVSQSFAGGVLTSHTVTIANTGTFSITATNSIGPESGSSAPFVVEPGLLHHFLVEAEAGGPVGTQAAGVSFTLRLTAVDAANNTVTGFSGTVDVSCGGSPISGTGTTANFSGGVLASHSLTLTGAGVWIISAVRSGGTESGSSGTFVVEPGPLSSFGVVAQSGSAIGAQVALQPFAIRVVARDTFGNIMSGFTGTVEVSSSGVLAQGGGTSGVFLGGQLASHTVAMARTGDVVITVVRSGGSESGVSDTFHVDAGPLHHFLVEAGSGGPVPVQAVGVGFPIRVIAMDAGGNRVESFTDGVTITTAGTLLHGGGTTGSFVQGMLSSHELCFGVPGTFAITARRVGGNEAGASNPFVVNQTYFTIGATSGPNGSIVSSGSVTVSFGSTRSFSMRPDPGYSVTDVLVDGSSIGQVSTFTFSNVTDNHTIHAEFARSTIFVSIPPESVVTKSPVTKKLARPAKRGRGTMPNWSNLVSETVLQGGFQPGSSESDMAGGMRLGISHMEQIAPEKYRPFGDSARVRAWVRLSKWNFRRSVGTSFSAIQRSLEDRTGMHEERPRGLDYAGLPDDEPQRPLKKEYSSLSPKKHNNALFAELVALKLNIVASQLGKTPLGFGELVYDSDGSACDEMSVIAIAARIDTMLTYWQNRSQSEYDDVHDAIVEINRAFASPLDTASFSAGGQLVLRGRVDLSTIPFLKLGDEIPRQLARTSDITEDNEEFEDVEFEEGTPVAAKIYQNYPNPFNPSTTIGFRLREPSLVTLAVYTLLGQEVAQVIGGEEFDEGYHTVEFSPSHLATGVYFYRVSLTRLDNGEFVDAYTRKMILMK